MTPVITAFDWVPPFARGQVRDLRVRWALEEVGQRYDVLFLRQGEQKSEVHRARQPFGQVPTYDDGDLMLFESGAIVLHIAERFGGLLPGDLAGRARAYEWMFAALNSIEPLLMDFGNCTIFEAGETWAGARLPLVRGRVEERLAALSQRLGEREWLDGDAFTAGDLMMVCAMRMATADGLLDAVPNLAAYVARGEARPAFGRALAAQLAGFTGAPPAQFREWLEQIEHKQGEIV